MENNYLVFDSGYRGDCKTETAEQTDLAAWIDFNLPWVIWFHVPNEGLWILDEKETKSYIKNSINEAGCHNPCD